MNDSKDWPCFSCLNIVERSFHKFEDTPINGVLGSIVVFKKTPRY